MEVKIVFNIFIAIIGIYAFFESVVAMMLGAPTSEQLDQYAKTGNFVYKDNHQKRLLYVSLVYAGIAFLAVAYVLAIIVASILQ